MKKNVPKITDGEMQVLEILWENSPMAASEVVAVLKEQSNWNRNTTYTFISRLVEKGVVKRDEPGFICTYLFTEDEVKLSETHTFLDKIYQGSLNLMISRFIENKALSRKELDELKDLLDRSTP